MFLESGEAVSFLIHRFYGMKPTRLISAAFMLIELLVGIVIIGIFAALLLPALTEVPNSN